MRRVVAGLTEDFHADLVRVVLFRPASAELPAADWLILAPGGAKDLPAFDEFIKRNEPLCGRLQPEKTRCAFRRAGKPGALHRFDADRRLGGIARHRQSRCQPLPPGHGYGFPEAHRHSAIAAAVARFCAGVHEMAADPLSRAVEQFIDHLRHQRRYSPATPRQLFAFAGRAGAARMRTIRTYAAGARLARRAGGAGLRGR